MIHLQSLPFDMDGLQPHMSRETLTYHYLHHHKTYVENVNKYIETHPKLRNYTLAELMGECKKGDELYSNVHQTYNHNMLWSTLCPSAIHRSPSSELMSDIISTFKGWKEFKQAITETALKLLGSGWVWVHLADGVITITPTNNADSITKDVLFVIDTWEHAYYLDHPADKKSYLSNLWSILNWTVINDRFANTNR